jgi:hypothetical protein
MSDYFFDYLRDFSKKEKVPEPLILLDLRDFFIAGDERIEPLNKVWFSQCFQGFQRFGFDYF